MAVGVISESSTPSPPSQAFKQSLSHARARWSCVRSGATYTHSSHKHTNKSSSPLHPLSHTSTQTSPLSLSHACAGRGGAACLAVRRASHQGGGLTELLAEAGACLTSPPLPPSLPHMHSNQRAPSLSHTHTDSAALTPTNKLSHTHTHSHSLTHTQTRTHTHEEEQRTAGCGVQHKGRAGRAGGGRRGKPGRLLPPFLGGHLHSPAPRRLLLRRLHYAPGALCTTPEGGGIW